MDWNSFDTLIHTHFEPLQYVAFFGALVLFGGLEAFMALGRDAIERRRRWPANAGLTVLNIVILGAMPVSVVAVADYAMARAWGLLNQPSVLPLVALVLGFVLRSLVSYGIHVAMHKLPLFWRVHRVHHTDTQMDISTTVRFHPLEFVISMPILLGMAALLGLPPLALMLYELFDAAMAVFTHANVRLPKRFDRAIRIILVTPAMHRIHHSAWQPETDSNYGATLSWWDWLFGTYRVRPMHEVATLRLGVEECHDQRVNSLAWLLYLPFAGFSAVGSGVRAGTREPDAIGSGTGSVPAR